ncbi:dipeptide/oligopeptide/nickel ABC transporter permease/ATP-binding protein [Rhodococcus sp. IEGM 1318]|uniref:dipeptide/oligopeptide/nickel ABC transporter permease/ATP-binding protein n=1 Tax=Rhodococcus sp. IEGM 1318 TaxID=3082226 RepID=UPI0029540817|nr:dipeptide/oligopeptide/nickel ABC transporter permease/ATP-binding protein [Rhodococcus sp. IEGM 1318]MDV8006051.1 dipeptide/oligopeptide/nickel ABC transporter permease/ATP-binding protein [Rhodococcus sp. IEGM 1318]
MSTDAIMSAGPASTAPTNKSVWRRLLKNPMAVGSLVVFIAIVIFGVAAPLLAPFDPNLAKLELTNAAPFDTEFLLGGDRSGRDILSRLMYATTGTLMACLVVLAVSAGIGIVTGLVAGYWGGRIDDVLDWVSNIVLAFPGLILLISLYTVVGPNITVSMAILGVLIAPNFFRLVRSLVLSIRSELYVDAARVAGLSDGRIISRHVLRSIRGPLIVQSSFVLATGISVQAGLEFLGLGDSNTPSWGGMLNEAFANIYNNGTAVVWPALLIGATTLSLVILGNTLRDTLETSGTRHPALSASKVKEIRAEREGTRERSTALPTDTKPKSEALLRIQGLELGYPSSAETVGVVVHGVDLEVRSGEIHGLVGESGSGKSQIAYSILGILPPEAAVVGGSVFFRGQDILNDSNAMKKARGRRIAYIPQEPMTNLDPTFTVGQQLTYGLRAVADISKHDAHARLLDLLARVGINDPRRMFDLYPHQISGGMAQRVLIAGALAGEPELIVADEPTTALDVTVQADVLDLLRDLQNERDFGVLLVTHNFGVVADICDRVSVMKEGRIVESSDVRTLFAEPEHQYTRMLLDSMPDRFASRIPFGATSVEVAP